MDSFALACLSIDKVEILGTRNNGWFSKMIRAFTFENISHVALAWDKLVFQSNLVGVNVNWLNSFLHKNQIVYRIKLSADVINCLDAILDDIVNEFAGDGYDYKAFVLEPFMKIKRWFFGGNENYGDKNKFLCTELLRAIDDKLIEKTKGQLWIFRPYTPQVPMTPEELLMHIDQAHCTIQFFN